MSDTSAAGLYTLASVLLGLGVISVILRFYARRHQKAPLLVDDWLLIPALVRPLAATELVLANFPIELTFIGVCVCLYYGTRHAQLSFFPLGGPSEQMLT